jgi:hypothetical protein
MRPWKDIKTAMLQANESPENIQAAFEEYQSMLDPNPNITVAPGATTPQESKPVLSLASINAGKPNIESINPAVEEYKKTAESIAQAKMLSDQLGKIYETADELIPAADMVKIGPFESGFMGSVRGLQRSVGNLPFIRTEDTGMGAWDGYSQGVLAILARGMGEKGVLTEQDIGRAKGLLPAPDDTVERRATKFRELKEFVDDRIAKASERLQAAGLK